MSARPHIHTPSPSGSTRGPDVVRAEQSDDPRPVRRSSRHPSRRCADGPILGSSPRMTGEVRKCSFKLFATHRHISVFNALTPFPPIRRALLSTSAMMRPSRRGEGRKALRSCCGGGVRSGVGWVTDLCDRSALRLALGPQAASHRVASVRPPSQKGRLQEAGGVQGIVTQGRDPPAGGWTERR